MKVFLLLFFVVFSNHWLIVIGNAKQTRDEPFPLIAEIGLSCDEIVEDHEFSGNCCRLFNLQDGGCQLKVINGRCIVDGPEWEINFRSTYQFDDCPVSDIVITRSPTLMPTEMPSSSPTIFNASGLQTFPPAAFVEGDDGEGMDAIYRGLIGAAAGVGTFLVFLALFCLCSRFCFDKNNNHSDTAAAAKGKDLEQADTFHEDPHSP